MRVWSTALEEQVLRINGRYNAELIESHQLCPYARGARLAGSSVRRVVGVTEASVGAVLAVIGELEARPEVEVAQLIFPLLELGPGAFQDFATEVGRANAARGPGRPVFVHAAFHPDLPYSAESGPRLVPFFRRSPDPLIQLVRLSVLDAIHASRPRGTMFFQGSPEEMAAVLRDRPESVTDLITRENHERAAAGGLAAMAAVLDDIATDRDASYAALATAGRAAGGG